MSEAFSAEQDAYLRDLIRGAVEMAVAAGVGDTPRILNKLDFMRISNPSMAVLERGALVGISRQAMDDANAAHGFVTNFAGDEA